MTTLEKINQQGISIVIGSRNEEKTLPMTICNLMEDCRASGITKYEVIIQDNGSEDETSRFFTWKAMEKGIHWKYQYSPRGMVFNDHLRIFFDPVMSNVGTRNKGVKHSRYENIIFSDAHIIVRPGTVLSLVSALDKFGGIIHSPIAWMGADGSDPQPGYQYSYKIGEKGPYGTWNKIKVADTPFYIPLCGHAFMAVKKKEFLSKGGYPPAQRVYGGGEPYLDTLYWMTGGTSMCDPGSMIYHLSAGRDYNWHSDDLLHNSMLVSYILGGRKWIDLVLMTYLNKPGTNKYELKRLYNEALQEGEEMRRWLDKNKQMTFEEVLGLGKQNDCLVCTKRGVPEPHVMRPWDRKNDELHGTHRSYVAHFALQRRDTGVFIGETLVTDQDALDLASLYV